MVTKLDVVVACPMASPRNDAFQPPTDPILMVQMDTQSGQTYLVPLSEKGLAQLWEVISKWRQARDFLLEQERPEPGKLQ